MCGEYAGKHQLTAVGSGKDEILSLASGEYAPHGKVQHGPVPRYEVRDRGVVLLGSHTQRVFGHDKPALCSGVEGSGCTEFRDQRSRSASCLALRMGLSRKSRMVFLPVRMSTVHTMPGMIGSCSPRWMMAFPVVRILAT